MVGCQPKSRGRTKMSGAEDETCVMARMTKKARGLLRGGAGRGGPDPLTALTKVTKANSKMSHKSHENNIALGTVAR
jgi:hypothetical protein